MERHKTFFIDDIIEHEYCGKSYFQFKVGGELQLPYDTNPTSGEHDYNICEDCQKMLITLTDYFTKMFEKFPECCGYHSNLLKENWFKKELYQNVPKQVSYKIIFTQQHIYNNIKIENWYNDITNYIDYTIESFGRMPKDCGSPLFLNNFISQIITYIQGNEKTVPIERGKQIVEYLESYLPSKNKDPKKKTASTDLNILLNTYQKWLKIFPFEIENFKKLKEKFQNLMPILQGEVNVNPYTGFAKGKLKTRSELIQWLVEVTKNLLGEVNSKEVTKENNQEKIDSFELSLINESHKVKQTSLLIAYDKGEAGYINVLKKWLENEKKYFKEIREFFKIHENIKNETLKKNKNNSINKSTSEQYIKPELIKRLDEVENRMTGVIEVFNQSKIKCAAWVELLMDKEFFFKEYKQTNLKSCAEFAKHRYGIDITIQMQPTKKIIRNERKKQLEKYLK